MQLDRFRVTLRPKLSRDNPAILLAFLNPSRSPITNAPSWCVEMEVFQFDRQERKAGMPYSCRNAFTGLIKLARRAGTKLAKSAARTSSEIIIA